MIINVRGTHGSGKSTLVRKVLERLRASEVPMVVPRDYGKLPLGYVFVEQGVAVFGSYEGDVGGGTDNITKVEATYDAVSKAASRGYHVIFEGILAQHSTPRLIQLADTYKSVTVLQLSTSYDECVRGVEDRRAARGGDQAHKGDKFKVTIEKEMRAVESASRRLRTNGIRVLSLSRDEALHWILVELELV